MASSITQTIGLGSDNRLSMDMIEKLRAVDEKAIIDPIDNNITETEDKKKALSEITSLMNDLESSVSSLGGDTLYLERTAYVSSEGINISIDKGVNPQSLSIDVNQLAKEEVRQSNTFASRTDTIADNDGNVTISLNGISETFSVTSSTTLEEFAQMINDSSLDATAKILNTGNNEYRLVLTSNVTGESNGFTITEDDGINLGLSDDNNIVQQAQDAIFQYNGVEVRRDSNKIDDLVYGVNLELTQVTDQPINIDIKEDSNSIASTLQNFVDNYNKLMEKLNEVTDYNEETKEAGVF
ncbi:MAG TPA: flagellar hook protein, partial [Campylobacterales bacterium]|nr:flagellar hook protein [Campylobacterales bacterium]